MSHDSCVISEKKVSQKFELRFGDDFESGEFEQFPIRPGRQIDAFGRSPKCIPEEYSKEDPKQGRDEYTSLLDSAADVEGCRS